MIGRYEILPVACRAYDPRAAEVAQRVAALIVGALPAVQVEHIGSTAVPGCAGKGIVDLMLLYQEGGLAAARDALAALGFQRQTTPNPFPEERPMRVGSIEHDGTRFLLHVHVIAAWSDEADELRSFRDRLRTDPALVCSYVAAKRVIIASGSTNAIDYAVQKGPFVKQSLSRQKAS